MTADIDTVLLPAHWASALINADRSGLTPEDCAELDTWLAEHPNHGSALSCSDDTCCIRFNGMVTDCLAFDFPYMA